MFANKNNMYFVAYCQQTPKEVRPLIKHIQYMHITTGGAIIRAIAH